jgi:hypothetical protein
VQSRGLRVGLLIALAAVAVALFIVLSGGDDDGDGGDGGATTTSASNGTTTVAESPVEVIKLANGAPVGGVRDLSYDKGERVRIRVTPEPGLEEVHIHGYEIERFPNGDKPLVFDFTADITGGFELEAHGASGDVLLANIKVQP